MSGSPPFLYTRHHQAKWALFRDLDPNPRPKMCSIRDQPESDMSSAIRQQYTPTPSTPNGLMTLLHMTTNQKETIPRFDGGL
ncbi:hypothetical protein CHS0354_012517 [Potamilus streckersoni]|uniref:Uncharacterized protein n=1 Tax=Potamilus streckersoni TaxID=2493646 RepID=A0AAE0SWW4_9BIVA|nr:hypothetical protein CHS0354_012517 [Potamilus streckersoni]